jgi:hypothetical protein
MPGKRPRVERLLEVALDALAKALGESRAPWMLIGGIAIIARGVRRFTTDIDAAVRGDAIGPKALLALFERHGITPRIEDAMRFAEENLVLLLRHQPTGVDLDVSFAWSAFEHEALAASTPTKFGRVRAPMCVPEDLVVFKAIAGRAKDLADAEALLDLYPDIDVARARGRILELSVLAEAPELVGAFDTMVTRALGASPKAARPHVTRPARRKASRRRK